MNTAKLGGWLSGEDHKDRIAVFDAVETAKPGDGTAGRLDQVLISLLFSAVGSFEVLPFIVTGCGDDASV